MCVLLWYDTIQYKNEYYYSGINPVEFRGMIVNKRCGAMGGGVIGGGDAMNGGGEMSYWKQQPTGPCMCTDSSCCSPPLANNWVPCFQRSPVKKVGEEEKEEEEKEKEEKEKEKEEEKEEEEEEEEEEENKKKKE